jgi:hypothetical protein
VVDVLKKRRLLAAGWSCAAAALAMIGLVHAYRLTPSGVENRLGLVAAPGIQDHVRGGRAAPLVPPLVAHQSRAPDRSLRG